MRPADASEATEAAAAPNPGTGVVQLHRTQYTHLESILGKANHTSAGLLRTGVKLQRSPLLPLWELLT
jgi:hypothetical protein